MSYQFHYRQYAEALYDALVEDAFYIAMEQSIEDPVEAREGLLKYLDYSMVEARQYGQLLMSKEQSTGVSIWSRPLSVVLAAQKSREKQDFLVNHMGQKSLDTYVSIIGFMSQQTEGLISENDWYLSIIGVLPEYQGQGFGPSLVTPVVLEADRQGRATYLETFTARNKTFYQRLGYVDVGVFLEPETNTEYSVMKREAQKV